MTSFEFPSFRKDPKIVYSDDDVIVAEKPAGMHTAPNPGDDAAQSVPTLLSWVSDRYPEVARVEGRGRGEGGLLHRLDRDTSGLVLFARGQPAFLSLSEASESGAFRKEYVLRSFPSGRGLRGCRPERVSPQGVTEEEWDALISLGAEGMPRAAALISDVVGREREIAVVGRFRAYGPGAARVACAVPCADLGKKKREWGSVLYRTLLLGACVTETGDFLEFRVALTRGFRHQVRAHLAWMGFPLLGDALYGGPPSDRLYLHAASLAFPHPATGRLLSVQG